MLRISEYMSPFLILLLLPVLDAIPAPIQKGWTLEWSEEWAGHGSALPSASNWIIDTGTSYPGGPLQWGTGEIETYTRSKRNLHVKDGMLYIKPLYDNSTKTWTSGRIETQRTDFHAPRGGKMKIQASIAAPNVTSKNGLGYWPAFWSIGADFRGNYQNWPGVGEFDIMEIINGDDKTAATLHCGTDPGGPCNEPTGLTKSGFCRGGKSCGEGSFNVYSVVLDRTEQPETVRFFVDGKLLNEITSEDVGKDVWNQAMHQGHFILLNVAIGGAYPNAVAGITTPTDDTVDGASMIVEYVAVYTQ